ncbi:MAG: Asp-tRNA(Asn)/Glu-tRNA(Gln) amidotransferase subunit GatC [Holosporaceae bacterium]|jgi:aspartyl-tRNA(Asn)/glutamyl-tRNA(Gln) amidotransferase subunit C|nr:Asp-tRNA(Asn)/Glu-tRNA(Gln) amidotransferase subunit GatC [Holosporaceae bacterium]
MGVSKDDVERVARLARIGMAPSETEGILRDLSGILNFVEQLRDLDCAGRDDNDLQSAVCGLPERPDTVEFCDASTITGNAPEKVDNMFVVPKVVG